MRRGFEMRYHHKLGIGILLEVARFYLASMVSFQFGIAVLLTGIWSVKILQWYGVAQPIIDSIFVPCGIYFLWAVVISLIDMNIGRDVL